VYSGRCPFAAVTAFFVDDLPAMAKPVPSSPPRSASFLTAAVHRRTSIEMRFLNGEIWRSGGIILRARNAAHGSLACQIADFTQTATWTTDFAVLQVCLTAQNRRQIRPASALWYWHYLL